MIALFALLAVAQMDRAEVAFDAAVKLRREAHFKEAAEAFERVAREHPSSRRAPHALSAAGSLYLWQLNAPWRAASLFDRVIAGPDDAPGVMLAYTQRLSIERTRAGAKGELALIHKLYSLRPTSEQAPYLLLRASKILEDDLDQPVAALSPAQRVVESFADTSWSDEATIREGRLLRKTGRAADALRSYRRLIATRTESFIVGEYDSDFLDEAYFELAETFEVDLNQPEKAEEAYLRLVDEMPDSIKVDDALHLAAEIARKRGDTKSAAKYHETLRRLRPDSRFLRPDR